MVNGSALSARTRCSCMYRIAIAVLHVQQKAAPCLALRLRRALTMSSASNEAHLSALDSSRELLEELCSKYGISSQATVGTGQYGLGLFLQPDGDGPQAIHTAPSPNIRCSAGFSPVINSPSIAAAHPSADSKQLLVSVPLHLVLSCSIPGCSPNSLGMPAELKQLLCSSCCQDSWELQVAALLLWAMRQPADTTVGGFWRTYAANFIPPLQQQHSLFLWSQQELTGLQDSQLMTAAVDWRQQVQEAYTMAVQPCFDKMVMYSSSNNRNGDEGDVQPCSYDEWLWAVAAVQSRAFGVLSGSQGVASSSRCNHWAAQSSGNDVQCTSADSGSIIDHGETAAADPSVLTGVGNGHQVGLVPVLDLANHSSYTDCYHAVDARTNSFRLYMTEMKSNAASSGSSGGVEMSNEVLISYGEKDNRQLMEQYGFCLLDNPHDRLQLPRQQAGAAEQLWMSHKDVKAAAELVKQQLKQQKQQQPCNSNTPAVELIHHDTWSPILKSDKQSPSVLSVTTFTAAQVDAAVASIIAAAGWRNLRQFRLVTPGSTYQVAQQLLSVVQQQLQSYATDIQEDIQLLGQLRDQSDSANCSSSPLAEDSWAAQHRYMQGLQYRIGQKQLLAAAERTLMNLIDMQGDT